MKPWEKHEKDIAEIFHGTLNSGSGNQWQNGLDVRAGDFRISCKSTEKLSFSLKLSDLTEAENSATMHGQIPILAVRIKTKDYVVLTLGDFMELIDE